MSIPPLYFAISMNDIDLGLRIAANRTAARKWVRDHVASTHMGKWRRLPDGFEYATTIGRYYKFTKRRGEWMNL